MTPRTVSAASSAVAPGVLIGVLVAHGALKALFFWGPYQAFVAFPIERITDGLITTVTLAGLLSWTVLVGGGMVLLGRMRLADLGLAADRLRDAWPVLLGLWAVVQISHGALGSAVGELALATSTTPQTVFQATGLRLQAVVGSGLLEEVLYRGFLLMQLFTWLRGRMDRDAALTWAIVVSSVYFGLNHIPAYLRAGLSPIEVSIFVGQAMMVGAMFGILFLRTGNLFVVAGAHALINDPVPLFATPIDPALLVLVGVSALMLAWPSLSRRVGRVFTLGTVEGSPVG